jgi:hypothetical protein
MLAELQRTIASAVMAGARLDAIEDEIINRAPMDEELKSALWLYAEVLTSRPPGDPIAPPKLQSVS